MSPSDGLSITNWLSAILALIWLVGVTGYTSTKKRFDLFDGCMLLLGLMVFLLNISPERLS